MRQDSTQLRGEEQPSRLQRIEQRFGPDMVRSKQDATPGAVPHGDAEVPLELREKLRAVTLIQQRQYRGAFFGARLMVFRESGGIQDPAFEGDPGAPVGAVEQAASLREIAPAHSEAKVLEHVQVATRPAPLGHAIQGSMDLRLGYGLGRAQNPTKSGHGRVPTSAPFLSMNMRAQPSMQIIENRA